MARTLHYLEQRRTNISLHAYAGALDRLLLQGGNDIAPESYGESPLSPEYGEDRIRDRYEIELLDASIEAGKPVLGICRGCQLTNVALGGTLYQDTPTQRPDALPHLDVTLYDHQFHDIEPVSGSHLSCLYPAARTARGAPVDTP